VQLLREVFELRGEDVVRKATGTIVKPCNTTYIKWLGKGRQLATPYHRVKFALAHGYLPDEVDHEDRDHNNNLLSNLRAATHLQNCRNRVYGTRDLPRGVYRRGGKFSARIAVNGRWYRLGTHSTPEAASRVVEDRLREIHGEFYREQPHATV
jgi:hypothetical protein